MLLWEVLLLAGLPRLLTGLATTFSLSATWAEEVITWGEDTPIEARAVVVEAWMILAAVASTVPSSSLCRTRCCRAALSVGSSTFIYWRVSSLSSSMTSFVDGTIGNGGKSVTSRWQPKEGRGERLCLCWEVASWSAVGELALHWSLGEWWFSALLPSSRTSPWWLRRRLEYAGVDVIYLLSKARLVLSSYIRMNVVHCRSDLVSWDEEQLSRFCRQRVFHAGPPFAGRVSLGGLHGFSGLLSWSECQLTCPSNEDSFYEAQTEVFRYHFLFQGIETADERARSR